MNLTKWSLLRFVLRCLAKAEGFLDPTVVFSHLQGFSKPSEVWVPLELLRSGAVLQARGLINSQAIQHNLDWIWPFWVERQFNPRDEAFIPRAFSMTHINLTYRNWTAIGLPDFMELPIVDPRGLVTPFFDGWSIDGWIIGNIRELIPSRMKSVQQTVHFKETLTVSTILKSANLSLISQARVIVDNNVPTCEITFEAKAFRQAWLVICIRPYNPEGISLIKHIRRITRQEGWEINGKDKVFLNKKPSRYFFSDYDSDDIYAQILKNAERNIEPAEIKCPAGMLSAAAIYPLSANKVQEIKVKVPLLQDTKVPTLFTWDEHLQNHCVLKVPDQEFQFLYETALRSLILHSPGDVYPGPFTYKRFWFRDAVFILQAMMAVGLLKNLEKILDRFPERQSPLGYFMSQDGEWDSNGQAIWILRRYWLMTRREIKPAWRTSIYAAAKWIQRKRLSAYSDDINAGLMPAGFSAEHFGPSNFYYWDDFWSVAGLQAAADVAEQDKPALAHIFKNEADHLFHSIEKSLHRVQKRLRTYAIPSSPYRRMDSSAIGSLVASYPLQIFSPCDKRILMTVDFLRKEYFIDEAFYHQISHSGINVYLTLHVAQVLLRAGNQGFFNVVKAVAKLASTTGQWPEAIHPTTKGGCMGDGQHIWATAEWVMMIRNMFVREEVTTRTIVLCSGIPAEWLEQGESLFFGETLTVFGKISVSIGVGEAVTVSWESQWHDEPPVIEIRLPGYPIQTIKDNAKSIKFKRDSSQSTKVDLDEAVDEKGTLKGELL